MDRSQPDSVPVIDLAPWPSGLEAERRALVGRVRSACEGIGFFVIRNHGVPETLIDRMYRISRAFFDLPVEEKVTVPESGDCLGGLSHYPLQAERLAATLGQETPGDLKESLDYGPGFFGGPWPSRPRDLHAVWHAYFAALDELSGSLRAIFASAMGLEDGGFEPFFRDHLSSLRVLNYPELQGAAKPGQLRAGEHTDYGFLTILRSEDRPGGLEVRGRNGSWIAPPAIPGTFIVNIGDTLMRWTNDRWVSTPHRVVLPPEGRAAGSRRQSIAFFHNPAKSARIECLAPFRSAAGPKYPPTTYGDYAKLRFEQAHGRSDAEIA